LKETNNKLSRDLHGTTLIKSGDVIKCISNDGCDTEFIAIYVNDCLEEQPIVIDISDANNITWYDDIENYDIVKVYKNAKLIIE
jgi:hypothetical protein